MVKISPQLSGPADSLLSRIYIITELPFDMPFTTASLLLPFLVSSY